MVLCSNRVSLSRCITAIEEVVVKSTRAMSALDVYAALLESPRPVSLSTVRQGLSKLYLCGRLHRIELPRTGRCLYLKWRDGAHLRVMV